MLGKPDECRAAKLRSYKRAAANRRDQPPRCRFHYDEGAEQQPVTLCPDKSPTVCPASWLRSMHARGTTEMKKRAAARFSGAMAIAGKLTDCSWSQHFGCGVRDVRHLSSK